MEDQIVHVKTLIKKSADVADADQAVKFAQSAQLCAEAIATFTWKDVMDQNEREN